MKLRLLISILFLIATTFTAIHELEHIGGEHDSSTCQVCVVDNHALSIDVVDEFIDIELFKFEQITFDNFVYSFHKKNHTNQNRAPPFTS